MLGPAGPRKALTSLVVAQMGQVTQSRNDMTVNALWSEFKKMKFMI
jgi:hypothetical protein